MKDNAILADKNIGRLLYRLSGPAIVGMFVQATYNVVDRIFVGQGVGTLGLSGLTVVFPLQMFVMALGFLVGIGASSLISRNLGAREFDRANRALGNSFVLVLILGVIVAILGKIFLKPLLVLFGANADNMPYAYEYGNVIILGNVFFAFLITGNNIIRSEGMAKAAMVSMMVSALVNIVLDPIFIFWLKMGVAGAAYATVIAQGVTALYVLMYFVGGRSSLQFRKGCFRIDPGISREIVSVGMSGFARQAAASVVIVFLARALEAHGGALSIAAYGIVNSLSSLIFMPIFGIAQGLQPVAGFNYGAKRYRYSKKAYIYASLAATGFSLIGYIIFVFFPEYPVRMFTSDPGLIRESVYFSRIASIFFPLVGFQVMGTVMFQALGMARQSLILSLSRQILFFLPLMWLFTSWFGLFGVWLAFPAADVVSTIVTIVMTNRQLRRFDHLAMEVENETR